MYKFYICSINSTLKNQFRTLSVQELFYRKSSDREREVCLLKKDTKGEFCFETVMKKH